MPDCTRCNRYFTSWNAYNQHIAYSSLHNVCPQCDIDFPTWTGLKEHWVQSPHHSYCQYCDTHFDDDDDLEEHYTSSHAYCRRCRRVFRNEFGLKEHYRQSERHHYCDPCNRLFASESNLHSHLNSSVHRPRDVTCPFRCGGKFVSRAALVLHLESGSCTSGINRNMIDRTIRQHDTNNVITTPSRLLTSEASNENVQNIATPASWNGNGYECYLCHNTYRSLYSLNQHLASPTHKDRIYRCPGPSCGQRFTVLSALVQHIESEKCGISRFKVVQNALDSALRQMGRLTL